MTKLALPMMIATLLALGCSSIVSIDREKIDDPMYEPQPDDGKAGSGGGGAGGAGGAAGEDAGPDAGPDAATDGATDDDSGALDAG